MNTILLPKKGTLVCILSSTKKGKTGTITNEQPISRNKGKIPVYVPAGTQEGLPAESLQVAPLSSLRPASPSNGLNGCGKKKRSSNKKPTSGSLTLCVSIKGVKE